MSTEQSTTTTVETETQPRLKTKKTRRGLNKRLYLNRAEFKRVVESSPNRPRRLSPRALAILQYAVEQAGISLIQSAVQWTSGRNQVTLCPEDLERCAAPTAQIPVRAHWLNGRSKDTTRTLLR